MKINARENEKGRRRSQPKTEPQPIDTKVRSRTGVALA